MFLQTYSRILLASGVLLASVSTGLAGSASLSSTSLSITAQNATVLTNQNGTATITAATLNPTVSGCSQATTQLVSLGNTGTITASQTEGGGQILYIAAPTGSIFTTVNSANYGTTTGCSSPNSRSVVESYLLGNNAASIPVENGTFGGDPCYGVFPKSLFVTATYSGAPVSSLTLGPGTYTIRLTVTGCGETAFATAIVTVAAPNCGPNNDKLNLCHNGHQICVAASAVQAHLAHGDSYGNCATGGEPLAGITASKAGSSVQAPTAEVLVQTMPNPSPNGQFQVHVQAAATGPVQINLFDMQGNLIGQLFNGNMKEGEQRDFSVNRPEMRQGLYLIRVQAGQKSSSLRMEVQK